MVWDDMVDRSPLVQESSVTLRPPIGGLLRPIWGLLRAHGVGGVSFTRGLLSTPWLKGSDGRGAARSADMMIPSFLYTQRVCYAMMSVSNICIHICIYTYTCKHTYG